MAPRVPNKLYHPQLILAPPGPFCGIPGGQQPQASQCLSILLHGVLDTVCHCHNKRMKWEKHLLSHSSWGLEVQDLGMADWISLERTVLCPQDGTFVLHLLTWKNAGCQHSDPRMKT